MTSEVARVCLHDERDPERKVHIWYRHGCWSTLDRKSVYLRKFYSTPQAASLTVQVDLPPITGALHGSSDEVRNQQIQRENQDFNNCFKCSTLTVKGLTTAEDLTTAECEVLGHRHEWVRLFLKHSNGENLERYFYVHKHSEMANGAIRWARYLDPEGQRHEYVEMYSSEVIRVLRRNTKTTRRREEAPLVSQLVRRFYPLVRQFDHVFVQQNERSIYIYEGNPGLQIEHGTFTAITFRNWRWVDTQPNGKFRLLAHPEELLGMPKHGRPGPWQFYEGATADLQGEYEGRQVQRTCWRVKYCVTASHYLDEGKHIHTQTSPPTACKPMFQMLKPCVFAHSA